MLTSASKALGVQKPVLTRDCMAYLRDNVESIDENEDNDEEGDGEHTALHVDSSEEDAPAGRAGLRIMRGRKLIDSSEEEQEKGREEEGGRSSSQ
eukprot:5726909-Pleurochrysis_carterae.AAC.1